MFYFFVKLLLMALVVLGIALVVPGVRVRNFKAALTVTAVYGILNSVVWFLLGFPLTLLTVLTLGLAGVVINAFLLLITSKILDDFELRGPASALIASVGITGASILIRWILPS